MFHAQNFQTMAKSVLIAESNAIFSEVLAGPSSLLAFVVVGTISRIPDLISLALETKPDLLFLNTHVSNDETEVVSSPIANDLLVLS
jgi:hypothetical protein